MHLFEEIDLLPDDLDLQYQRLRDLKSGGGEIVPYPRLVGQLGHSRELTIAAGLTEERTLVKAKVEAPEGSSPGVTVTLFVPTTGTPVANIGQFIARIRFGAGGTGCETACAFQNGVSVPLNADYVEVIGSVTANGVGAATASMGAFVTLGKGYGKQAPLNMITNAGAIAAGGNMTVIMVPFAQAIKCVSADNRVHDLLVEQIDYAGNTRYGHHLAPGTEMDWAPIMTMTQTLRVTNLNPGAASPYVTLLQHIEP